MVSQPSTISYQPLIDHVTEPEWNRLLPLFADASLYQTWAYGAVSWGENNLSHLLLKQNDQVVGMAQFRIVRIPLLSRGIAYLRWGPLYRLRDAAAPPDLVLPALMRAITDEYARRRRLLVRILPNVFRDDPVGPPFEAASAQHGFQPSTAAAPYRTIRVDLAGSFGEIRKRLDQKWRNKLNGAERNCLTIREGTGDDLFAQFTAIYRDLLARKQFETTVNIDEFARIQRALPEPLKMRVLLCEKDGKVMAGLVGTTIGDTGIYLLGATSSEGMKAKGSYLLQWRMMQWLRECGCRWYDLGGVNAIKNPGVYQFKQGFGGTELAQLPRLEFSASRLSAVSVKAGEKAKRIYDALRAKGGLLG